MEQEQRAGNNQRGVMFSASRRLCLYVDSLVSPYAPPFSGKLLIRNGQLFCGSRKCLIAKKRNAKVLTNQHLQSRFRRWSSGQ